MKEERKLGGMFVTLGTDLEGKFSWCIREVDGVKCVVIHEAKEGNTFFNEKDYVTAIPVESIEIPKIEYK